MIGFHMEAMSWKVPNLIVVSDCVAAGSISQQFCSHYVYMATSARVKRLWLHLWTSLITDSWLSCPEFIT